jgi:adenylosuccinate lyase
LSIFKLENKKYRNIGVFDMIPRYTRQQARDIWSNDFKYQTWFKIEATAAQACAKIGMIPQKSADMIVEKGKNIIFNAERIDEIESEVKHDVIAFLTHVAELIGDDARFLHQGMTSSDVLDTAFNVQLVTITDLLLQGIDKVLNALKKRAFEHQYTPTVGRSHGIHAEPTTFGLKLANHYAEFKRCKQRLLNAKEEISVCAISGAVGTFAHINPFVEEYVAQELGFKVEPISTQIIPRDRYAMYFSVLGIIACAIERLATEIRHLQRTEVLEAEEFFAKGQKGSSAMPHKRNPVLTENLTGLARLIRSAVVPAMENVVLWHERDISHSAVERGIAPDTTVHLDFALHRLANVIENLVVYPENMQKNLDKLGGLVFSQRVLLALTQNGSSREDAYQLVQKNAMKVWRNEGQFLELLSQDTEVTKFLSINTIQELFDMNYHTKYVDTIFKRVFVD